MASQSLAPVDDGGGNRFLALRTQLEKRADEFRMVLPSHIEPEKFQRTILTAVQSEPSLLEADRRSFLTACMKAAQDGLLPDKREAALVTFMTRMQIDGQWQTVRQVQYMQMVYGLRKKILQSEKITDITAKVVYRCEVEAEAFVYEEGTEATLRHRPLLDIAEDDATDDKIVAAYSMATYKDGTKSYEVMRRFEIDKVRQCSQTGAVGRTVQYGSDKGKAIPPKGPWVDWFPEMAKKTVMRRHSATLPMSGDLIDIEGREIAAEMAARSAQALLASTDPTPPTRLEDQGGAQPASFDPSTGEIYDDVQRDLDRQGLAAMDGQPSDDGQSRPANDDDDDNALAPWVPVADDVVARCQRAEIIGDVLSAESDFAKHKVAMPEAAVTIVEKEIAAAKARIAKPKAGR